MKSYSLKHLSRQGLDSGLAAGFECERGNGAWLLAHIAEYDQRRYWREAGYNCMSTYLVGTFHISDESAFKRVAAARAAYEFPTLFAAVADGRLHPSAILLIGPKLTAENVDDLIAMATHQTCTEIRRLLAERFPRPDVPTSIQPMLAAIPAGSLDSNPVTPETCEATSAGVPLPPSKLTPRSAGAYLVQMMFDEEMLADFEAIRALSSDRDVREVVRHALKDRLASLRKKVCKDTPQPRACPGSDNPHYIPADLVRAVWLRDGGQCTYVSTTGHRCEARRNLQIDHVVPLGSPGGETRLGNLRLLCSPHNQLEAERVFGAGFMRQRREAEQERREAIRAERQQRAEAAREAQRLRTEADRVERRARQARLDAEREARRAQADRDRDEKRAKRERVEAERQRECEQLEFEQDPDRSIVPWLRKLGFTLPEARRAVTATEHLSGAPLAQRVKAACRILTAPRVPAQPLPAA